MKQKPVYQKFVEKIKKDEFISFYSTCDLREWFSPRELQVFTYPGNLNSLAGRYLIKRTICDFIKDHKSMHEIEILNNDFGKPAIVISSNILKAITNRGIRKIECSISHSMNYITGMTLFCY
jgi:phosphopantetheinyl transferase (holo-ACP synthase)